MTEDAQNPQNPCDSLLDSLSEIRTPTSEVKFLVETLAISTPRLDHSQIKGIQNLIEAVVNTSTDPP